MNLDFPKDPSQLPIYQKIQTIRQSAKCLIGMSLRPVANTYRLFPQRQEEANSSKWFMHEMIQSAKYLIDTMDAHLVFFSMHPEQDDALGHQLAEQVNRSDQITLVPGSLSPSIVMATVGLTDLFIGMRLHSLVFAARSSVPMIALGYDPKVRSFMAMLDQDRCVLPPAYWTARKILRLTEDTWCQRSAIRDEIAANLPALQRRAERNVNILFEVLRR
jgi:polysaccharide pyruvyl transferase WcaK-like protein